MIKFIKISFLFVFVSLSSFSVAEDNESILQTADGLQHYDEVKYETIDDVFDNLSNRMILGTFGRESLIVFLPNDTPESVTFEIQKMDDSELAAYSSPFNYGLVNITLAILFFISAIATVVMLLYMAWITLERTIVTGESGEFLGKNVDSIKSNLKFLIVFSLILPVMPAGKMPNGVQDINISLIQFATIKLIGISSYTGDKIFEIYANNTPSYYPVIEMPQRDGKYSDMINLIKYTNCINAEEIDDSIEYIPFNFKRMGESKFQAESGSTLCKLKIKISFDTKTESLIDNNEDLAKIVPFNNYLDIQFVEFKETMNDLLKKANKISKNIINGDIEEEWFSFSNKEQVNKFETCEELYNYSETVPNQEFAYNYINEAAKCLSEDYIRNFAKIPNTNYYDALDSDLFDVEMCSNRKIEQSENDAQKTELTSSQFILNQKDPEDMGAIVKLTEYSQKKIEDCIKDSCSNFSNSSIYQCSNAIGLGYEHYSRKNMAKKGWITSGAYIYKLFSNINTNTNGRLPITSFNINFFKNENKESISKIKSEYEINNYGNNIGQYESKLNLAHTNFQQDENQQEVVEEFNESLLLNIRKLTARLTGNNNSEFMNDLSKYITEDISRFNTCMQNPLEISSGISCGNVTTEISRMGNKILNMSIYLKISLLVAELKGVLTTYTPEGDISGDKKKNFKKQGMGYIKSNLKKAGMLSIVGGGTFGFEYISGLMEDTSFNSSFVKSDSFNKMVIATTGVLAFYVADGNEKLLDKFNSLTWILFSIGIVLTFIVPLIPFTLWVLAVMGWLIGVFQLLVNLPLWAATTISVSDQDTAAAIKVGIRMMISMIIRIPLMTIGLIIAWLLTNVFVQRILSEEMITFAINYGDSGLVFMAIDYVLILIIYVIMLITIYNILFSLIEGFHELAMNWMGDQDGSGKLLGKEGGETTAVINRFKQESGRIKGLKWRLGRK